MSVKVEVLYAPTCAGSLRWLERIRESLADFGSSVTIEEIDVLEHPEVLRKYQLPRWQQFTEGYAHYLIAVAVNRKALEDWYWDPAKIVAVVKCEIETKGHRKWPRTVISSFWETP